MLREEEILNELIGTVQSIKAVNQEMVKDTNLMEAGVLDSLDFIDYVFRIQERFRIRISDEDLEKYTLGNLGNMVSYLMQRLTI